MKFLNNLTIMGTIIAMAGPLIREIQEANADGVWTAAEKKEIAMSALRQIAEACGYTAWPKLEAAVSVAIDLLVSIIKAKAKAQ